MGVARRAGSGHGVALVAVRDPALRDRLAAALRGDGFEVVATGDGDLLFQYLDASQGYDARLPPPVVLVTDAALPGHDGLEALRAFHELAFAIPVLVLTEFGDLASFLEATRLGAAEVFERPIAAERVGHAALVAAEAAEEEAPPG